MSRTDRTEQLAGFIVGAEPSDDALQASVVPIVDTIGVMLAGRRSDAGRLAMAYAAANAYADGAPGSWLPGLTGGAGPEVAALLTATRGHALDYDDAYPGAGHPSSPVLASALATGARAGGPVGGSALTDAFVVGFEVMAKLADALGVVHYYKGWHVTCTSGTFGATAAACRLLHLDRDRTLVALGIAGSLASGMQRNFGTTTKPLHSGLAARNGVLAATLAQLGASADQAILDGDRGLFDVYGQGGAEPRLLDELGAPFSLVSPGTAIKKYPCCFIAVRPVDALLGILRDHALAPDDVERITCRVPSRALHAMIYPRPTSGLQGKFSMEYILAAALCDGAVGLATFTDESVHRPHVRAAMERVIAREDAALRPEDPEAKVSGPAKGGWIEVTVRTMDGRELTRPEYEPHGGPRNPFGWDDVRAKFLDCAEFGGYDVGRSASLVDDLADLRASDDVLGALRAAERGAADLHRTTSGG